MNAEQIMAMLGMSDLQFALAVIGLLILISVVVINLKHLRKLRKAKELSAYLGDDRVAREPSLGKGFADVDFTSKIEPIFGSIQNASLAKSKKFIIDPRIDCVITLRFDEVISGSEILEEINAWTDLDAQANIRWTCEGLNGDLETTNGWEELNPRALYSELQLAIQLASRRGPISVLELSDFCSRAQALAVVLDAQIDMPSVNTMLESAKELDVMAAESDIQLSINILFDEPYQWGNFDILMRQHGFKLGRGGRSYEYARDGLLLFNSLDLEPNKAIHQLTLLLEIPLVRQEMRAFELMLSQALEIAQAAHGRLVDDNGINLSESAVNSIRQHLDALYANLEKSGIAAGSSTASRLFS